MTDRHKDIWSKLVAQNNANEYKFDFDDEYSRANRWINSLNDDSIAISLEHLINKNNYRNFIVHGLIKL